MKLISFSTSQQTDLKIGLVQDNEVVDIARAGQELQINLPDNMQELIAHYTQYQPGLKAIQEEAKNQAFSQVQRFTALNAVYDLATINLSAPLPYPRKNIFCMAVNYNEHARETAAIRQRSAEAPTVPVIFTKAPTSINGPYGPIEIDPAVSTEIDWEVELGVIIGKAGKNISEENAMQHIFGYTVINDVTARDLQARHKQFFKGKSLDGSCPMGPWIVTADEIPDPHHLQLQLRINGITKQDGNTKQMVFSIPQIIATLSLGMTLEAGDIIATGTPSGVGFSRVPPEFLRDGDIMESEVEKIGVLRNPVVEVKH